MIPKYYLDLKKKFADSPNDKKLAKQIFDYEKNKLNNRKGDWMTTYMGGAFWLLDPRPEEVDIRDIAHALSLICRYNGHLTGFYSVAQHSVLVSENCLDEDALFGLLHDAAEAYTGDIISPLKKLLPNYKVIEENIMKAVLSKFKIKIGEKRKQRVKYWDNVLMATEVRDLVPQKFLNWKIDAEPLESKIKLLNPKKAEAQFLQRFNTLYGKAKK